MRKRFTHVVATWLALSYLVACGDKAPSNTDGPLQPDLLFADGGDGPVDPCAGHCHNGVRDCGEESVDCGGECAPCASSEADFYVDPTRGDDDAEGSREAPFATVARARDAVRELRQSNVARVEPVLVLLRGGTYWLADTLRFGPEDSGTETAPTIYRAYPDETPVLSGGKKLEGFVAGADGRWRLLLNEVVDDGWVFTQLWVDGERRWRPRLPKKDHYFIHRKLDPVGETEGRDNRFGYRGDELRADWHNLGDVEVLPWHHWTISRLRIAEVDAATRAVTFTAPTRCDKTYCQLKAGYRYLVENVKEALEEPGEFYLDSKTGELIYIPLADESPSSAEVVAPHLEQLLAIGVEEGDVTEHLVFEGITFSHTHWATPAEGYSARQADVDLPAAIELVNARRCKIVGGTVSHTGAYGVGLGIGARKNRVEGTVLTDLGAGGIHVGHDSYLEDEAQVAAENVIRDNLIAVGGRMHPAGIGVLLTNAAYTTVEHNDIADFYYTGISVGWNWGYTASNAHDNTIAYNRVHQIGQGVLSDMGGIYTLGISPGTTIHHNVFSDISRNRYGGWGIYFDQASSQIVAEHNVVYATQDEPLMLHFGENLTVRNNIWIAESSPLMRRGKAEEGRHTLDVEHNVFFTTGSAAQFGEWEDNLYSFDNNVYWSTGAPLDFDGRTFAEWQATGQDTSSVIEDPRFVDPAARDYTFGANSPATRLGVEQVDVSTAGRLSAPRSGDLPESPRAFPAAVGTAPIDVDFEEMSVGEAPTYGEIHAGSGAASSLEVTAATAAAGTAKSLLFLDTTDNTHSFNPHYVLPSRKTEGVFRLAFSLRWDAGAIAYIEWRDWRVTPYLIGPSIHISAAGDVVVAEQTLTQLVSGQWVRCEITAALGDDADGTFSLSLHPEGGSAELFDGLACGSADFDVITWMGFVSNATSVTTFYLDEIVGIDNP